MVPVLFTFHIQGVLKLKKHNSGAKRLRKAMGKQTLFRFNAVSGTLRQDVLTLYCCERHKFAIEALLCKTQNFYV